ncbi:peptidase M1 [Patiriisocius marinistellae]|uniref:Peptidase M1 n=2 Tax=Patiriisocius marinistellae TaxID=2494560 RepID=A0A5J4FXR8_9FLAO|nr:peptidase M1 [Patiriisocius marinistellae]
MAQNNTNYWQQHVDYTMNIDVNADANQYKGEQTLVYTNNSPDVLDRVFYHLYFNAFQPESEMDARSLSIEDPDGRVGDRISKLNPDEIGYIKPTMLTQDGKPLQYELAGTVLEVKLNTPIQPGAKTTFKMEWDAQVPLQVRRSGRDNAEGVKFSMSQWYPKLAEYDFQGWHADPYIGREFHSPWGDFDVTITIDKDYTVAATGYSAENVKDSKEYKEVKKAKKGKRSWNFVAPNVHDFTWAADKDYIHDQYMADNGVTLNFYYKDNDEIKENWKNLQPKTAEMLAYFNEHVGQYPYKQYSVIQGGDGGMEYAMATLITGNRKFGSLMGVTAHELAHTWFQFLLATNEGKHEWMDEGFTSYISSEAMNYINNENNPNVHAGSYRGYQFLATSGKEQPATTHADRYAANRTYSIIAYAKGAVFLSQLGYVIGKENLDKTLKKYFEDWAFKHPTPNDFIRVAEKVSGLELDWYLMDFMQTTNTIDYGIKSVETRKDATVVTLERIGLMGMPIDLDVTYTDGTQEQFYIPLQMMRGEKANPYNGQKRTVAKDWAWAYPTYELNIPSTKKVKSMMIDASKTMADINAENNSWGEE